MPRKRIEPGLYRHFKGGEYEVLGTAELVDSDVVVVVYRRANTQEFVVRPYENFVEQVSRDGKTRPRFELVRRQPLIPTAVDSQIACHAQAI